MSDIPLSMYSLASELFKIPRSLTGEGVRDTLKILKRVCPALQIKEIPTGTQVFDWVVPKEWVIRDAYIKDPQGRKIVDFHENNLCVVGYSLPVNKTVSLAELKTLLYTLPEQPNLTPYVTSYYKERFGFCMPENLKRSLPEGDYQIFIDSELFDGVLNYGEVIIPGESEKEIFVSTYICHPQMANNELSGPCVAIYLAQWLANLKNKYTYRIIFIPETIGSIAYLSKNIDVMKRNIVAGFNISCVGDNRVYSYLPSRGGDTLADKAALNALKYHAPSYLHYSFLERGSDERQYNAPGVDLPVCSVMRSKFGQYPEYHTSADDLTLISPEGLGGAYTVYKNIIAALEHNECYKIKCLGEPQLGKRGLYPTESYKGSADSMKTMMDFIAYADGKNDLIDISNIIGAPVETLIPILKRLQQAGLLGL